MDQLEAMRFFTRVVETEGFAAAARDLGVSRSVVNKQVIALERSLNTQLLRRSTRQVTPTEAGTAFYHRCVALLVDFDDAVASVTELQAAPFGQLRINAPMTFGVRRLSAVVAEYMAAYPDIRVELVLNDRFVDPIEEGFDLTIRIGEPQVLTSLITCDLATVPRYLCASPGYLEAAGVPADPTELRAHRCLHYGYQDSGSQWRLRGPQGERSYAIGCVLWSNNGVMLCEAAVRHQGIVLLPDFIVSDALDSGALTPILPDHAPAALTASAVYPRHRHLSNKVRQFVDLAVERLGTGDDTRT